MILYIIITIINKNTDNLTESVFVSIANFPFTSGILAQGRGIGIEIYY